LHFSKNILKEAETIENGIGSPDLTLTLCLLLAWAFIGIFLLKGIKSSGKVAYFLAVFPYIVLIILLIRSMTLPGAMDGVLYFVVPEWDKLFEAKLW
jgi:solute carrier family 6 amino acid transporter-like protein 5/7/9/14